MTATDNTLHPTHCVKEAQELAAELFGAAATFYLGGGATTGIAAMILAAVPPGGEILLPRNVHRSVAAALVLSGARPRFIEPEVLPECGALGIAGGTIAAELAAGSVDAVLLTRPTYYGLARELADVSAACRAGHSAAGRRSAWPALPLSAERRPAAGAGRGRRSGSAKLSQDARLARRNGAVACRPPLAGEPR